MMALQVGQNSQFDVYVPTGTDEDELKILKELNPDVQGIGDELTADDYTDAGFEQRTGA